MQTENKFVWFKTGFTFLETQGFKRSDGNPCLYIHDINEKKLVLALYVDYGLIAASDEQQLNLFC